MPQQQMFTPSVTECDSPVHSECAMAHRTSHLVHFIRQFFMQSLHRACLSSGVGVRLKMGDKYWEDWRGRGLGRGCALPSWGSGACSQNFALKIMQYWASFGTSFLYYSRIGGGGLSPSPESGGPIPLSSPCSDAYMCLSLRDKWWFSPSLRTSGRGRGPDCGALGFTECIKERTM